MKEFTFNSLYRLPFFDVRAVVAGVVPVEDSTPLGLPSGSQEDPPEGTPRLDPDFAERGFD